MDNLIFLMLLSFPVLLIAFITTLIFLPKWIKKSRDLGLVWEDMHKKNKPKNVAGSGGLAVILGFLLATFLFIAIKTFVFKSTTNTIEIFAILTTLILAAGVGLIDDLFGWKKGGLSKKSRIILMFFIAIPLMVVNAGVSTSAGINFGILYPLILIPLGIVGATTTFNFMAGFNGLEASQGIILLSALSIVSFLQGSFWLALMGGIMIASLLAFWLFNKYPAKVFPGDTMTYFVGAMIACMAIVGNMEKIAIFFFIPYILEVLLKARGKLVVQSFGKLEKDGSLSLKQKKIYGLEHLAISFLKKIKPSKKAYEWEIPIFINIIQLIFVVLGFILFF